MDVTYSLQHTAGREFYSCPPLQDDMVGICSEECSDDTDCQNSEKCCSNGCGHVCTRAVRIPHYDPPADTDGAPICPILHNQISNTSLIGSYIPQCSADGSFSPIQCHGSTGYCWCVHVQTGEPVSGVVQFSRPPCTSKLAPLSPRTWLHHSMCHYARSLLLSRLHLPWRCVLHWADLPC